MWSKRTQRAFTLLEVMAAVAVFAITFLQLSKWHRDSADTEGLAQRRLEASLIADRWLADVEAERARGEEMPEVGRNEDEDQGFRVVVELSPFELTVPERDPDDPDKLRDADEPFARDSDDEQVSLLEGAAQGMTKPPILKIQVSVSWLEAQDEHSVERTSFIYDGEVAAEIASRAGLGSDLFEPPDPGAAGTDPGGDGPGDGGTGAGGGTTGSGGGTTGGGDLFNTGDLR